MIWNLKEINEALRIKKSVNYNFNFSNISIDSRNLDNKFFF